MFFVSGNGICFVLGTALNPQAMEEQNTADLRRCHGRDFELTHHRAVRGDLSLHTNHTVTIRLVAAGASSA